MANDDRFLELEAGLQTAYVFQDHRSSLAYRPEFISNDPVRGKKVLVTLENELALCDEFIISVAFITMGGITPLMQTLKELELRGVRGKILTTDYLSFSDPRALRKLDSLSNIELRMYRTEGAQQGFHTKGYIFRQDEIYRIIIGSSNMTQYAITQNKEWNTKLISTKDGEVPRAILSEFNELWNAPQTRGFHEFIEDYEYIYEQARLARKQMDHAIQSHNIDLEAYRLRPNKMQTVFVKNLLALYHAGTDRAMLLSSTGTGKTYASAFGMRELQPQRLLFLVHREQIAKQALRSFEKVFGTTRSYGLLSGTQRELNADFLFSTMQMMSKAEIHQTFASDAFDAIILDECHHVGSPSYQRIMQYFKPKLWLGMTASPDTTRYDIYSIFDHNIAHEIRLSQALEDDLLCPFHYFGISDLEVDGEVFDDQASIRDFNILTSDARVDHVIEKAKYFGFSGDRVKGLIFCSRKQEAEVLSEKFNLRDYQTVVLTGEDSQVVREETLDRLTKDDLPRERQLDYIFTIDIFNEGVDIPEVNQVIMLRPTESPVVFIQQLGRGLRKFEDKEYVVILDFIGNYMNNFMIPIALSGDRSYNKDSMRRFVREGTRVIPGSSTIHFDEISRRRIYDSIDAARTNTLKLLKESYTALKYKMGQIPRMADFKRFGELDLRKYFDYSGSYHQFLVDYEPQYQLRFSAEQTQIIEYLSKKVTQYKRIHDLAILYRLITGHDQLPSGELLEVDLQSIDKELKQSILNNLSNQFPIEVERKKYAACRLIEEDEPFTLTTHFERMLEASSFKDLVLEILEYGIDHVMSHYQDRYEDTQLVLYQKYTYEDVCRLLNWEKNLNGQNIGGYFYEAKTQTLPVFINYHKDEDAIAYEDRFLSESDLIALSKKNRSVTSSDADRFYKRHVLYKDLKIYLFVRRNKDDKEAKEFYFLGEIEAQGEPTGIHMDEGKSKAFEIHYRLETPVRSDIYDYITES